MMVDIRYSNVDSLLLMATLFTKIKCCLLMTAVFSVHTADRYGAYRCLTSILPAGFC